MLHRFLQTDAQFLARTDPDGQFPASSLREMISCMRRRGADMVVGQRDEASVSGYVRFVANVILRLAALHSGMVADPNSGCYVMNRRAAAALCQVPLPKYPEPRMLVAVKQASLRVVSSVVPTLPRQSGHSSMSSIARAVVVFLSSLLEFSTWDDR